MLCVRNYPFHFCFSTLFPDLFPFSSFLRWSAFYTIDYLLSAISRAPYTTLTLVPVRRPRLPHNINQHSPPDRYQDARGEHDSGGPICAGRHPPSIQLAEWMRSADHFIGAAAVQRAPRQGDSHGCRDTATNAESGGDQYQYVVSVYLLLRQ